GRERDEAGADVAAGDAERAPQCGAGSGLLESELLTHHEADPGVPLGGDGVGRLLERAAAQPVVAEDAPDLGALLRRHHLRLLHLAGELAAVGLGLALGSEVATEPHRDRAGRDLREPPDHDQEVAGRGADQAGGEGERGGEAVRHPEDEVTHDVAARDVTLRMLEADRHRAFYRGLGTVASTIWFRSAAAQSISSTEAREPTA